MGGGHLFQTKLFEGFLPVLAPGARRHVPRREKGRDAAAELAPLRETFDIELDDLKRVIGNAVEELREQLADLDYDNPEVGLALDAVRGTEAGDVVVDKKKGGVNVTRADRHAGWGRASEAAPKLAAVAKHAQPYLTLPEDRLDADPWLINVANGTLQVSPLRLADEDPVRFRSHSPADLITKRSPVAFDPGATCPAYDAFLEQVQPDPLVRRFLHAWGGLSLVGHTREQKLVFLHGRGKNGKSTLVDIWGHIAGDYGATVPIETFLDQGRGRNAGGPTPDIARLFNLRFLRTSEPEKNAKLAEAFIKLVTGGEPMTVRPLYGHPFEFRPVFKLTMSGNYRPAISGADEGIWRRMVLVPWLVTVEKPDPDLPDKLIKEAPGILNRLLDGLRDYLESGLILPDAVAEATSTYRADSDPLGRFLEEATERIEGERVPSRTMHSLFIAWGKASGEREWSANFFGRAMRERGYASLRSDGMWWLDVRLKRDIVDYELSASPHPSEGEATEE